MTTTTCFCRLFLAATNRHLSERHVDATDRSNDPRSIFKLVTAKTNTYKLQSLKRIIGLNALEYFIQMYLVNYFELVLTPVYILRIGPGFIEE